LILSKYLKTLVKDMHPEPWVENKEEKATLTNGVLLL